MKRVGTVEPSVPRCLAIDTTYLVPTHCFEYLPPFDATPLCAVSCDLRAAVAAFSRNSGTLLMEELPAWRVLFSHVRTVTLAPSSVGVEADIYREYATLGQWKPYN